MKQKALEDRNGEDKNSRYPIKRNHIYGDICSTRNFTYSIADLYYLTLNKMLDHEKTHNDPET